MNAATSSYGLWSLVIINSLVFMYVRLARREEHEALAEFGQTYAAYMREVSAFVPRLSGGSDSNSDSERKRGSQVQPGGG